MMRVVVVACVLATGCFTEAPPVTSEGESGSDGSSTNVDTTTTEVGSVSTIDTSDVATGSDTTSSGTTDAVPDCGNEAIEVGEDCDDGNDVELDGCTAACTIGPRPLALVLVPPPPVIGNGVVSVDGSCQADDGATRVLGGLAGWRGGVDTNNAWTVSLGGSCLGIGLGARGQSVDLSADPTLLPEYGNNVAQIDQWSLACPMGAVPIGISGRIFGGEPPNIVAVRLECGVVVLDPEAQSGVRVDPMGPTPWTPTSSSGGEPSSICPPDTIAVGFRGDISSASAAIYSLGPLCAQPIVPFGPP